VYFRGQCGFEFIPEIPLRAFVSLAVKVLVFGFAAKTILRAVAVEVDPSNKKPGRGRVLCLREGKIVT